MKLLSEKIVNTDTYAGTVDLITGIDDFKAQVVYDNEWHTYKLNGKIIPSVTQLLADDTYKDVDKNVLEYARNKGTIVHKEIETYLKTGIFGFSSEFYAFMDIYTSQSELFEKRAIFDFKTYSVTTPQNRKKCYEQIKLYAGAVKYLTGEEIEGYYLVHLPHNGNGRVYDLKKEFENAGSK